MNDERRPARNAAATTNRCPANVATEAVGLAALDGRLDVRERLVTILDALDADDPDTARFYAQGLLDDFDHEVHGGLAEQPHVRTST